MQYEKLPPLELDKKHRRRVDECPCGKSNKDGKFIPYVAHDACGYCHACGETFLPPLPDQNSVGPYSMPTRAATRTPSSPQPSTHPSAVVGASLQGYQHNGFALFLESLFGAKVAGGLLGLYRVGTAKGGKTVFWQLDAHGGARAGKIILYDPKTGKRSKSENPTWVHSLMQLADFNLKQSLFGSHVLASAGNVPVGIVEAEKTAILASAYFKDFIWLATGGSNGSSLTSSETIKLLKGRNVVLFPDTGTYEAWATKAEELRAMGIAARVSSLLEDKERPNNWDLADELLSYRDPLILEDGRALNWALTEPDGYPLFWDEKISEKQEQTGVQSDL